MRLFITRGGKLNELLSSKSNRDKARYYQKYRAKGVILINSSSLPTRNKWKHKIFYEKKDNNIVIDERRTELFAKKKRKEILQRIFISAYKGLLRIAVDKEDLANEEYIMLQIDSYTKLTDGVISVYGKEDERAKPIIKKHNEQEILTLHGNLILNEFRSMLNKLIDLDSPFIDDALDYASSIKLNKEALNDLDLYQKIKDDFNRILSGETMQ